MGVNRFFARYSPVIKAILIFIISLLLLAPVAMIDEIVKERKNLKLDAVRELASTWGGQQVIHTPILYLNYHTIIKSEVLDSDNNLKIKYDKIYRDIYLSPLESDVIFDIDPEVKTRGLYEVNIYSASMLSKGTFGDLYSRLKDEGLTDKQILNISEPQLLIGISHLNGLESIEAEFGGKTCEFEIADKNAILMDRSIEYNSRFYTKFSNIEQALPQGSLTSIGAELDPAFTDITDTSELSIEERVQRFPPTDFSIDIKLRGSEMLGYIPIGSKTNIRMQGKWETPKFAGGFATTSIDNRGGNFVAGWDILSMNLDYPTVWKDPQLIQESSIIGLELYTPVDNYRKTERATKYAILIIGLVFIMYYFTEMKDKYALHPVHYVLVGISIAVFYLLLLSFSEIIGFEWAYFAASAMVLILLTIYTRTISDSPALFKIIGILLVFIFTFVYVLLTLSNYSLVAGSVGIFFILATLMYYATKIDWYNRKIE